MEEWKMLLISFSILLPFILQNKQILLSFGVNGTGSDYRDACSLTHVHTLASENVHWINQNSFPPYLCAGGIRRHMFYTLCVYMIFPIPSYATFPTFLFSVSCTQCVDASYYRKSKRIICWKNQQPTCRRRVITRLSFT